MPEHFKDVCTCGAVIAQCRCYDPNKKVNILQDACAFCRAKLQGATYLNAPLPQAMKRRTLLLAVPQVLLDPRDPWRGLVEVWNPFAERMNAGVVDLKCWRKVVAEVDRIEGRKSK